MLRILSIIAAFLCLVCCDKTSSGDTSENQTGKSKPEIDYSKMFPDSPDGEFYRTLRQPPEWKVTIDLRDSKDVTGIPEGVRWFPMGDYEFCAIQGTTDLSLTLPSGQIIHEEFAIVYVDKDNDGIFSVRADSLGWLKVPVALQRLEREQEFFAKEGADALKLNERAADIRHWLDAFDHNSNMYEGLGFRSDEFDASFSFIVSMTTEIGIRYCYRAEITRSKTRLKANWDARQTNAEQAGSGQPATRPESDSKGSDKPQPESEGRSQ